MHIFNVVVDIFSHAHPTNKEERKKEQEVHEKMRLLRSSSYLVWIIPKWFVHKGGSFGKIKKFEL